MAFTVKPLLDLIEDRERWYSSVGRELRQQRVALGISQRQLAQISGVTQPQISRIELGEGKTSSNTVRVLVTALADTFEKGVDVVLNQATAEQAQSDAQKARG